MNSLHFLESERLYLTEITLEDIDLIHHLDKDPEVLAFIGPPKMKTQSLQRIEKNNVLRADGRGFGKWLAYEKMSSDPIGWFYLGPLDTSELIEVGYRLKKDSWGKGFATEMTKVILNYAFQTLELAEVAGVTHPDNIGSQNVLLKSELIHLGLRFFYGQNVAYFEMQNPYSK